MAAPPNLTTTTLSENRRMYGSASANTCAFSDAFTKRAPAAGRFLPLVEWVRPGTGGA